VPLVVVDRALHLTGTQVRELSYGPLLLTGFVMLLGFFILTSMPTLQAIHRGKPPSRAMRSTAFWARVAVLLVALLAVALGWEPVLHWIASAR
jgi:Na+-driven multidrug efflux pump